MSAVSAEKRTEIRGALSRTTLSILIVGTLLRVVFFLLSQNNGGDAFDRLEKTEVWLRHPSWQLAFGGWLPLHFWLMAALGWVLRNVALGGRLLSLLLGIASLWVFWKLARELYDEAAANLSLLVFSFYSLHIGYATSSSSEVPYLFFVLAGLACFFVYRRRSSYGWLALGGICLTLGAAIRYEAWIMILAVGIVLLLAAWESFGTNSWRASLVHPLLIFGATAGAWPAFWMPYCWKKFGHPLFFVAMQHVWVPIQETFGKPSWQYTLSLMPGVLLLTLSPFAIAGALYALWLATRERKGREFAIIAMVFVSVQAYQLLSGGMRASARYTITAGTLLAVMSGYGLEQMVRGWFPMHRPVCRATIVAIIALNLGITTAVSESQLRFSDKFRSISPLVQFTHYIEDVANYLRPRLNAGQPIVIDNFNYESNLVAAAVGLTPDQTNDSFLTAARDDADPRPYMQQKHPRYLVFSDRGTLRHYLSLPDGCQSPTILGGMTFRCVFEDEIYRIFEVTYR
jgi:dolichyl-phosphate-mannose-protein mannosyltransferase